MYKKLMGVSIVVLLVAVIFVSAIGTVAPQSSNELAYFLGRKVRIIMISGGGYGEDHIITKGKVVKITKEWLIVDRGKSQDWCQINNIAIIEYKP